MAHDPGSIPGSATASSVTAARRGRPRDTSLRTAVLRATLELLRERASLSIEAISSRSGVSRPTIYRWWPNKTAVALEAFMTEVNHRLVLAPGGGVDEELRAFMHGAFGFAQEQDSVILASVIASATEHPDVMESYRAEFLRPRQDRLAGLVARQTRAGELRQGIDPTLLWQLLWGPVYLRLASGDVPVPTEFLDQVVTLLLTGLLAPPRCAPAAPPEPRAEREGS